ncbi:MAG: hypothetical protein WB762_35270 [Candidatus Sulfotelmatobacter sp.]
MKPTALGKGHSYHFAVSGGHFIGHYIAIHIHGGAHVRRPH